jgi:hypothetical protein
MTFFAAVMRELCGDDKQLTAACHVINQNMYNKKLSFVDKKLYLCKKLYGDEEITHRDTVV